MIHESRNVKRRTLVRRFFNADGKSGGRQKREWEPGGAAGDLRVRFPLRRSDIPKESVRRFFLGVAAAGFWERRTDSFGMFARSRKKLNRADPRRTAGFPLPLLPVYWGRWMVWAEAFSNFESVS